MFKLRCALITASDKTGLDDFVRNLSKIFPDIQWIATDGTEQFLRSAAPEATVANVAEFIHERPENQDLVKTLDIRLFSGILLPNPPPPIPTIDLVVAIAYPFPDRVTTKTTIDTAVSLIDIGGIALLRAAAKNYRRVVVISRTLQYASLIREISETQEISLETRLRLATEAFRSVPTMIQIFRTTLEK